MLRKFESKLPLRLLEKIEQVPRPEPNRKCCDIEPHSASAEGTRAESRSAAGCPRLSGATPSRRRAGRRGRRLSDGAVVVDR
jgi:hypothetical protein